MKNEELKQENSEINEELVEIEDKTGITITYINHILFKKLKKLGIILATASSITLLGTIVLQTSPDIVSYLGLPPLFTKDYEKEQEKEEDEEPKEEPELEEQEEQNEEKQPVVTEETVQQEEPVEETPVININPSSNESKSNGEKQEEKKEEKKEEKQEASHQHKFTEWSYLNDNLEHRVCLEDGYEETRGHTLNGFTYNATTGKEECTCATCGHVFVIEHTNHNMTEYSYNPAGNNEVATCTICGYAVYRDCEMTGWTVVNGTTEERHCTHGCGHSETRAHEHMHALADTPTIGTIYSEEGRCHSEYYQCSAPGCPNNGIVNMHDVGHSYGAVYQVERQVGIMTVYDKYEDCSVCGYHHYLGTEMPAPTIPVTPDPTTPDPTTPDPSTPDPTTNQTPDPTASLRLLSNSIISALRDGGIDVDIDLSDIEYSKSKSA